MYSGYLNIVMLYLTCKLLEYFDQHCITNKLNFLGKLHYMSSKAETSTFLLSMVHCSCIGRHKEVIDEIELQRDSNPRPLSS